MTTTIRIPEEFARRFQIKDGLRWGSGRRYGEWKQHTSRTPFGRQKVRR